MIKELREGLGLTQKDLADKVGVDVSTLRNWENGRTGLDLFKKFSALCSALECNPQDLISNDP